MEPSLARRSGGLRLQNANDMNDRAWMDSGDRSPARADDAGDSVFPMASCHGLPLEEATIDQMQGWMSSGKVTSRQLTECYIGRITQLNEYVK